ncbi:MAG TPA: Gfo/Idh/MocA family oxidoreductase [Gemmatimonadaceae bacterium]|nr:Gfo/Idh/MocA family oxidoreductase [Gemmatimonadaceae bacterium]
MRDRLGVLFLGCGWATTMHSRTLRKIGGVDLFYASRDAARAEEFRSKYGGRRAYGSYEAAVGDANVDVALVATPTSTHRALTVLALNAGKHVIVEKPAFMKAADVIPVRGAAGAAGRSVFVAENYYYKPITRQLRKLIGAGAFGDVRFVTVNATKHQKGEGWRGDPSLSGGGALFEAGVHWVNFLANIGLEVRSVSAHRVGSRRGPDQSTLTIFTYSNGAIGTLAHSWELAAPFGGLRLSKIQGTRGSVTFESNGLLYVGSGGARSFGVPAVRDFLGYRAMFTDFLEAVRQGRPPQFTLELAERDLVLLEQAEASMAAQQAFP